MAANSSEEKAAGNPTLYDVAEAAGVSLATASRAINGSTRKVNDAYRVRVLAAAQELGYTPNLSAQAVAKGMSNTVALLVSDITDPYFSSLAAGVVGAAAAAGLMVTMAVTDRQSEREVELVRIMRGQRPQIIIVAGSRLVNDPQQPALTAELTAFTASGGRVVMISQKQLPFDTVMIDNRSGAAALASALVARGYLRFGMLSGPADLLAARDRSDAFRSRLNELGIRISEADVVEGGFTRTGGFESMQRFIEAGRLDELDVVFAVNDVMAIGAMAAMRDSGMSVAIAGYDDIPSARDVFPALTTVHVPLGEAGERAIALALTALETDHSGAAPTTIEIATTLALRESTPAR